VQDASCTCAQATCSATVQRKGPGGVINMSSSHFPLRSGILIFTLCIVIVSVSSFKQLSPFSRTVRRECKSQLKASFWGNYKSDGKREGNIGLAIALLLCIKGNFMSIDVRKTYMCPSGAGSERVLASLIEQEPSYKCLPINELFYQFLTSPLVFPGDPKYDPQ
jgi:hypothetical protein